MNFYFSNSWRSLANFEIETYNRKMHSSFRILVGCKRVIDYAVKIRVRPDGTGVESHNIKYSMNPFDEIALEESLRIREKLGSDIVKEIVAVSCGPDQCQETLRTALAMGADRAIHVQTSDKAKELFPLDVARIFSRIVKKENSCGLVLLGKQAIDDDSNHTGQILAGILGWPQATFSSKIQFIDNFKDGIKVTREVDSGTEDVQLLLPAIITTDLRLNEPRYATLQNIMKAKAKPIAVMTMSDLGLNYADSLVVEKVIEPTKRSAGTIQNSPQELLDKIGSIINIGP